MHLNSTWLGFVRGRGAALLAMVAAMFLVGSQVATACPFCSATAQTFSEEIASMDGAVLAKLLKVAPQSVEGKEQGEIPKATFEIYQVLKGDFVKPKQVIEALYFGEAPVGTKFLITGVDPKRPMWSTPLKISDRAETYLAEVLKLPKDGVDRVRFFINYLEDKDDILGRDSYDEFAKAPYAVIKQLKPDLKRDVLMGWIKNPEISGSHRRLYLVLLGICGTEEDLPYLEEIIRSTDRKKKLGLDSLIACYLTLKGEEGLTLIEDLYLKNKKADYAETYSAIMALRFHVTEGEVISKDKLVAGFRLMLSRSELADLVIPDLARFEDWDSTNTLMELYRKADANNAWVRVPVINFLRASPKPEAKRLLKECEELDPAAFKRANAYFPKPAETTPADPKKASQLPSKENPVAQASAVEDVQPSLGSEVVNANESSIPSASALSSVVPAALTSAVVSGESDLPPVPVASEESYGKLARVETSGEPVASSVRNSAREENGNRVVASINKGAPPVAALKRSAPQAFNVYMLVGIPWLVGIALFTLQWSILRGIGSGRCS